MSITSRGSRRGAHHRRVTSSGGQLRKRILGGETLFGAWCGLGSPAAAQLLGVAGYDWGVIDLEHRAGTEAARLPHLYPIETTGGAAIGRPQSGDALRIGRGA